MTSALGSPMGLAMGLKRSTTTEDPTTVDCDSKSGSVLYGGTCYTLYSQGPCPFGQWLVPQRRGRSREGRTLSHPSIELWSDPRTSRPRTRARCDCRPGHKPVLIPSSTASSASNSSSSVLECQPPTVVLATFLNSRGFVIS